MKEKELLFSLTAKDFRVDRTKGSGKGGQNRNKRETAIRITHIETGIQSYCADERNQEQNKRKAFRNLFNKPEFQKWFRIEKSRRLLGKQELEKQINQWVDEQMQDEHLKVEVF